MLKNELTKGKNNRTGFLEPDWIWWDEMSNLLGGPVDHTINETLASSSKVDTSTFESPTKRNKRATVHHINIETPERLEIPVRGRKSRVTSNQNSPITPKLEIAPAKPKARNTQTPITEEDVTESVQIPVDNVNSIKSRRRTVAPAAVIDASTKTPSTTNVSRRRTIHPKGQSKASPKSMEESLAEIPFFENEQQTAKSKAASESWDQLVTHTSSPALPATQTSPLKKTKELSLSFSVKIPPNPSPSRDSLASRQKKRKLAANDDEVDQKNAATPMDTDQNSSPQTGTDECSSTAMFVENRLRTLSGFKRQHIIFKIHELFYQEEAKNATCN